MYITICMYMRYTYIYMPLICVYTCGEREREAGCVFALRSSGKHYSRKHAHTQRLTMVTETLNHRLLLMIQGKLVCAC